MGYILLVVGLLIAHTWEMLPIQVTCVSETLTEPRHRSTRTIGRLAAGQGDFYSRRKIGSDIATGKAQRATCALWLKCPADVSWPTDNLRSLPRPVAGLGETA